MVSTQLPNFAAVQPVEVLRTNDYSEGPVVDHQGNLFFSHGQSITRMAPDGVATVWARTHAPNGHKSCRAASIWCATAGATPCCG